MPFPHPMEGPSLHLPLSTFPATFEDLGQYLPKVSLTLAPLSDKKVKVLGKKGLNCWGTKDRKGCILGSAPFYKVKGMG